MGVVLGTNLFEPGQDPMKDLLDVKKKNKDVEFIIENRQALQVLMKIQELDPKQIKDQVNSAATQEKTAVVEKNNKFKIFIVAGVAKEINKYKEHPTPLCQDSFYLSFS